MCLGMFGGKDEVFSENWWNFGGIFWIYENKLFFLLWRFGYGVEIIYLGSGEDLFCDLVYEFEVEIVLEFVGLWV